MAGVGGFCLGGGGHEFFDEGRVFRMELGGNGLCGVEGAGVWFFHDFPDG